MAIKLAQERDKTMPKVVEAVVTKKLGSLEHQAIAKIKNEEQVGIAGRFLHRIHNG
jgi:hypothetical protein